MGDQDAMGTLMGLSPQSAALIQQQQGASTKRSRQEQVDKLAREKFALEQKKFTQSVAEYEGQEKLGERIQSSDFIPGAGFAGLTRSGEASLIRLPEEDRILVQEALEAQAKRRAGAAGQKQAAIEKQKIKSAANIAKEKKLGIGRANVRTQISKAAQMASRTKPKVAAIRDALDAIKTGKFTQAKTAIGQYIPGLDISDEQFMQSQITQFVLDTLNEQTGTKTDFDFKKAEEASAAFGKTSKANKMILDILIKNLDRSIDEGEQFNLYDAEEKDPLKFIYKPKKKKKEATGQEDFSAMSDEELAEYLK